MSKISLCQIYIRIDVVIQQDWSHTHAITWFGKLDDENH